MICSGSEAPPLLLPPPSRSPLTDGGPLRIVALQNDLKPSLLISVQRNDNLRKAYVSDHDRGGDGDHWRLNFIDNDTDQRLRGDHSESDLIDAQLAHLPLARIIDALGEESAQAQGLKKSITTSEKFCDPESKDLIYMMFGCSRADEESLNPSSSCSPPSSSSFSCTPLGFIRVGSRDLYLHDSTCLRLVRHSNCVLDFFSRTPRMGVGRVLLDSIATYHSLPVTQWAFDRPSEAMLHFLRKHYSLTTPLWQYNHFVIFSQFSFQPRRRLF